MLSKRKFENIVSYGDFTFYGNKTFADDLNATHFNLGDSSIPQSCIISSSGWISDLFQSANIPQSAIISTSGWIKISITTVENFITDAIDTIYQQLL